MIMSRRWHGYAMSAAFIMPLRFSPRYLRAITALRHSSADIRRLCQLLRCCYAMPMFYAAAYASDMILLHAIRYFSRRFSPLIAMPLMAFRFSMPP